MAQQQTKTADKMAVALHEHVTAFLTVLDWIDENPEEMEAAGGVLPDHLEELLEEVEGDVRGKMERVALMERHVKANADQADLEAKRIADHAKAWERKRQALRTYLAMQLRRLGETRVDWASVKVRRQLAGQPSIRTQGEPPQDEASAAALPFWKLIPARYEFDYRAALDYLRERDLLDKDKAERLPDGSLRLDLTQTHGLMVEWSESAIVW